jgi:hypothetical protein
VATTLRATRTTQPGLGPVVGVHVGLLVGGAVALAHFVIDVAGWRLTA